PDVVHFEFGALASDRMALRERLGSAVTVSFRGYDLNYVGLDDPDHYREVWDRADGIHVLGEDLWRRAIHRGAPPDLPHTVITPAIDASAIVPTPARPGLLGAEAAPLRVLSVGRLHWKKGYDYALDAIAALRAQRIEVEYRIVGDGDLLAGVAFWRRQLGIDDNVELLRSVPPAEVARQLSWADVFLHSATSEGFCNAVIEAQAHGVPVVCSDADGLPENVEHEVTGFVVPRRDLRGRAEGVARLAGDAGLRARMGAAGRDRVERLFRLEDQIDAWVRFYEDAVERRRAASSGR
ncbi:MAG: glycosyltransferase family 4 protein, partial [Microthrixaceae bacterium]|nr:glycosyltransferase family 4 protein [Microthrixaceae bacterium]